MNTKQLTSPAAWKGAGKKLAGILVGMVGANQVQKLIPTSINANLASGGLLIAGGAGSIMTEGFLQDVFIGVTAYAGLKTLANVAQIAALPAGVKTAITNFVPSLAGIGTYSAPMLLNPGGNSPYIQPVSVEQMNGGGVGITTDVSQMS